MEYDIIFVTGEPFYDHPLCGFAILKRLLEKQGYTVGIIEMPQKEADIAKLGKPRLFFGVSSGSIDSMVRNYTPLKKSRLLDKHASDVGSVPDRAVIVYSNWIRTLFKSSKIVLGGTEATLRRFVHYDYWQNRLRKPILFDSRADIMAYGCAEKQILEIARRIKAGQGLEGIPGTCIISKEVPPKSIELPSYEEVISSKEKFCDMQNLLSNISNISQKIDNRYVLQYKSPEYSPDDIDGYFELAFTRKMPKGTMEGFEFSVVTHRGCIGDCNFCSLRLTQGNKIISRTEESILREIRYMTRLPHFTGNIDDFGGPSANMYGMDCHRCERSCIDCKNFDRSSKRLISLLRKARDVPGVKKINIRSGIRYDLATKEYLEEVLRFHTFDTLRIAPEHVSKDVLALMNKDKGSLQDFLRMFRSIGTKRKLSFYFMTAHPGSSMKEAKELAAAIKKFRNAETVQVFTPTPMTVSTCMYYTGLDPKTRKKVYVPYTYSEKKQQKRVLF